VPPLGSSDSPPTRPIERPISLDKLCDAVSADTGIPPGRVRRILLSAERLRTLMAQTPVDAATSAISSPVNRDPLRWYPVGDNGRLQPPSPVEQEP